MVWWNPLSFFKKKKPEVIVTTTTPPIYSVTPTPTDPIIREVTPPATTQDIIRRTDRGYVISGGGGVSRVGGLTPSDPIKIDTPTITSKTQKTITQQLKEKQPEPLSIHAYDPSTKGQRYEGTSFLGAGWQSFTNIFRPSTYKESKEDRALRLASFRYETTPEGRVKSLGPSIPKKSFWERAIDPFKFTVGKVGDQPTSVIKVGSIGPGEAPYKTQFELKEFYEQDPKARVAIERARVGKAYEAEVGKEFEQLQTKVSAGEITLPEAQAAYKELEKTSAEKWGKEFQTSITPSQKRLGKTESYFGDLYESPSYKFAKDVPTYAETGFVIGGSVVAPTLTGAYLVGSGLLEAEQFRQKEIEGYQITTKERLTTGIKVGAKVGFGAGLGYSYLKNLEKGIAIGEIEEHLATGVKFQAVKFQGDKASYDVLLGTQKTKYLQSTIKLHGKTIQTYGGKGGFMPSGKGTLEIEGNLWNYFGGKGPLRITSIQQFDVGVKSFAIKDTFGRYTLAKGVLEPKYGSTLFSYGEKKMDWEVMVGGKPKTDYFLSVSQKVKPDIYGHEQYFSVGGKIKEVKAPWLTDFPPPEKGAIRFVKDTPRLLEFELYKPQAGITKVIRVDNLKLTGFEDDVFSGIGREGLGGGVGGARTSLSKTFQPTTDISTTLKGLGETGLKTGGRRVIDLIKPSKSFAVSTGFISGGETELEKQSNLQFKKTTTDLKPQVKIDKEKSLQFENLSYKLSSELKTKAKAKTKLRGVTSTSTILKPTIREGTKYAPALAYKQFTGLKTKQKQKLKMFTPTQSSFAPSISRPFGGGYGFGVPIIPPLFPKGAPTKKPKKGKRATRKTEYVPTITARTYGFTASTIPTSYIRGMGGLGGRPVIIKKKKKRKSKKKR